MIPSTAETPGVHHQQGLDLMLIVGESQEEICSG